MTRDLLPKIIIQILTKVFFLRKKIYIERERDIAHTRTIDRLNGLIDQPADRTQLI